MELINNATVAFEDYIDNSSPEELLNPVSDNGKLIKSIMKLRQEFLI